MHQNHPHQTVTHSHNQPPRQRPINHFMAYIHDTELWAYYLPRIPLSLYLLALVGLALIVLAFTLFRQSTLLIASAIALGVLMLLPLIVLGLFVLCRSNHRTHLRRQLLDSIPWRGDEQVLDVGCGSGLLLNGAAQRLTSGKAIGIDIWAAHGGGGDLELLLKNAKQENVADRIEFKEADARQMPFENDSFDVVLSSGAMHHISHNRDDFDQPIHEMIRVLKPGGQIVIWDVTHMVTACASRLNAAGVKAEVKDAGKFLGYEMGIVLGRRPKTRKVGPL